MYDDIIITVRILFTFSFSYRQICNTIAKATKLLMAEAEVFSYNI